MVPDYLTHLIINIFLQLLANVATEYHLFVIPRPFDSGSSQRTVIRNVGLPNSDTTGGVDVAEKHDPPEWHQNESLSPRVDGPILSLTASLCNNDHRKIQLWNMDSERLEESPMEHRAMVTAMAASKDKKWIVSGDDDGVVVIWNAAIRPVEKMEEFVAVKGDGHRITALDIAPDSSCVAIGSTNGTMVVWCIKRREYILGPLQHQNVSRSPVSSLKFSPAGGRIASSHLDSGRGDRSIQLWHSRTGALLESIGSPHSTYSLTWSVDGHRLFTGGLNGSIKCFDVLTRTTVEWRAPSTSNPITSLYVSYNNQLLVSVSLGHTNTIDIWSIQSIPLSPCKLLRSHNEVFTASVSPDSAQLVSVGRGHDVTLWSLSTLIDKSFLSHRLSPSKIDADLFTYVSNTALEPWQCGNFEEAEEKPSEETEQDLQITFARVNLALLRARRGKWDDALKDVRAILQHPSNTQATLVAQIVEGVAYHGKGRCVGALEAFQSALCHCGGDAKDLVKCVKSIALLGCTDQVHRETDDDLPDGDLRRLVEAQNLLAWDARDVDGKDYEKALTLLNDLPDLGRLYHLPEVKIISLVFDWDLHHLISDIHGLRCRALSKIGKRPGAISYLLKKRADLSEEFETIQAKCSSLSEEFGDEAMRNGKYDETIAWYSEALALAGCPSDVVNGVPETSDVSPMKDLFSRCPQCLAHLLGKRSEVKAIMESWKDALVDAAWAIKNDPSHPCGYERKFVALHAQGEFKGAVSTLRDMSSRFLDTHFLEIGLLRNYSRTMNNINEQINAFLDKSPFVLIDVKDGHLYDQKTRRGMFEKDPEYLALVSSMSTVLDIKKVVEEYFCYVMFSHTWEGEEPSFKDVFGKSVYQLAPSPQNDKLRKFCGTVRDDHKPHRWSWSDTCCINKEDRDTYEKSIRFMYRWYHNSALTLILLAHPSKSNPSNSTLLKYNRWMFRAWTLQELLAPKNICFYSRNWELYADGRSNHKTLAVVKAELQDAMGDVLVTLDNFSPDALTVRQRLCMASTREATVKIDIAYALIGIFNSDIHVEYTREGEVALGLLLQEIVNRQGDITVLDWIGKPSMFNSCIPSDISAYKPGSYRPYELPCISNDMVEQRANALDANPGLKEEVTSFYNLLTTLGLPRFADRRLSLPCITFSVVDIASSGAPGDATTIYRVLKTALGDVPFKTKDTSLPESPTQRRMVLVYPWIRDLLAEVRHDGGNKRIRVSRLITHIEQGFRALLFVAQSDQQYRRVASDEEILVSKHDLTSLEDVSVEVLEIWEKS